MDEFKAYLIQEEKSELTVEKYIRDVQKFLLWLESEELDKGKVLAYKAELVEQYAVVSVNSIISSINSYLAFIGRGDCRVKTVRQQKKGFLPKERELSKEEYNRLLKAAACLY